MIGAAEPRFVLHEDDGVFGVFDRVGPQIFFAESRERAEREVARANEIVARFPDTLSMRHLREMDAEWRVAHGLPVIPAPAGRTVMVPDPGGAPAGQPSPAAAAADGIAEILDLVATVSRGDDLLLRGAALREEARSISGSARDLLHAWREARHPLPRLRAALRETAGREPARHVEASLRAALAAFRGDAGDLPRRAGELLRAAAAQGGWVAPDDPSWSTLAADAARVAELDRALEAATASAGLPTGVPLRAGARAVRDALSALRARRDAVLADLAAAREPGRSLSTSTAPRAELRRQWREAPAAIRDAVLQVAPEVPSLIRPPRGRGKAPGRARQGRGLA